jgi:hypothetical protein
MSNWLVRSIGGFVAILVVVVAALYLVPPLLLVDAAMEGSERSTVDSARQWAITARDASWLPIRVRYIGGRCWLRMKAVYFEEWTPPYLGPRYAVALASIGAWSGDEPAWDGAYGLDSLAPYEAQLVAEFGEGEACT